MAGMSHRVCPKCGSIITFIRGGLYTCDKPYCYWKGVQTDIYYIEFPDTHSCENRRPIYQGTW